jgi:hypothetical protein
MKIVIEVSESVAELMHRRQVHYDKKIDLLGADPISAANDWTEVAIHLNMLTAELLSDAVREGVKVE